jgi:serine/threonine protein kinase
MINTPIPDYQPLSLRGAGAFGYVIEAYDRNNDCRVAIKRTHKVGSKLSREYQILAELKDCEQCVKMLDTFYTVNDDGKVIQNVVFEYVSSMLFNLNHQYRES